MAVKTITVTEGAYMALKSLKAPRESFSETILRVAGKRSLKDFAGAISEESADKLEKTIKELRKHRTKIHQERIQRVVEALRG